MDNIRRIRTCCSSCNLSNWEFNEIGGLLSAYVTNAIAAPISTTSRILMWRGVLSKNRIANLLTSEKYFYPSIVACRVSKYMLLAGFTFDQIERKSAEVIALFTPKKIIPILKVV